jgi:hypothetical protein
MISYYLIRDEVEFRWAGNKRFLPGTANDQVGNVYNAYMTGDMGLYYASTQARSKKSTASKNQYSMALELYIDKPQVYLSSSTNNNGPTNLLFSFFSDAITTVQWTTQRLFQCGNVVPPVHHLLVMISLRKNVMRVVSMLSFESFKIINILK